MEKSLLELRSNVAKRADQLLQESCSFGRKQQQQFPVGGAAFANVKNEADIGRGGFYGGQGLFGSI
ncbi:agamous-like MADS-box protein AGL62 [Canna indica]|uniref:Agamous-like MADS-box protein AGL62 n=1 Tax=Canna indica TaxID=4628 RepID=A0AAQ3JZI2_9LILI|nr:agamous-like MADS-box protein AGL62 [Canna indica]